MQLYNPYSLNTTTGLRDPFPNNMIPATLLSPAAVKLLEQFGAVSGAADQHDQVEQLLLRRRRASCTWIRATSSWTGGPEDKDYFNFRYSHGRQDAPGFNTFPLFYNSFNTSPFQNGVLNWTRTFSPNLVNEARFGVNNIELDQRRRGQGLGQHRAPRPESRRPARALLERSQGFTYIRGLGNANIGTQQLFANTTFQLPTT